MVITLDTRLKDLCSAGLIGTRTCNSLHYAGYSTLGDVKLNFPDLTDLLKIRNFGLKSLLEIRRVLDSVGLMSITLNTTLKDLYAVEIITTRTYNVLCTLGCSTLGDVKLNFPDLTELLNYKNFGQKSLFEIECALGAVTSIDDNLQIDITSEEIEPDIKSLVVVLNKVYDSLYNNSSEICAYIRDAYPKAIKLHNEIFSEPDSIFKIVLGKSRSWQVDFRKSVVDFVKGVSENLNGISEKCNSKILILYDKKYKLLVSKFEHFSCADIYNNFCSDTQKELLNIEYEKLCKSITLNKLLRFQNEWFPDVNSILPIIDSDNIINYFNINFPYLNQGTKGVQNLIEVYIKFKNRFNEIVNSDDENLSLDKIKRTFPFLIQKQRQFVLDFEKYYNCLPLIYIILNFIRAKSYANEAKESKYLRFYAQYHGIVDEPKSLENIAKSEGISKERVRQLVTSDKIREVIDPVISLYNYSYIQLEAKPYFFTDDDDFALIKDKEKINCTFRAFAAIFCLYFDFEYLNIDGVEVLVSNELFKGQSLKSIIKDLECKSRTRIIEDIVLDDTNFFRGLSASEKSLVLTIVKRKQFPSIEVDASDRIIIKKNSISVHLELVNILEENGFPMFLDELYDAFKERFPDHKYESSEQLRSNMKSPIVSIGRQSRYALEGWGYESNGIKEYVYNILKDSEEPMHINALYDRVLEFYPNTTIKSILSFIIQDENGLFVQFEGGFYGLTERKYIGSYVEINKEDVIHRYKFEDRYKMFVEFVNEYHRFPLSSGGKVEASLYGWYRNVTNRVLDVSDDKMEMFAKMVKNYIHLGYPTNALEAEFLNKCNDYKDFVLKKHHLPTRKEDEDLYFWMLRSKYNMDSFTDQRRKYMIELLTYLSSFGFVI